jgi:hypothetical protein
MRPPTQVSAACRRAIHHRWTSAPRGSAAEVNNTLFGKSRTGELRYANPFSLGGPAFAADLGMLLMKKLFVAALLASALGAGASVAHADTFTLVFPPAAADGSLSANFGRSAITGAFTDTWNFTLPSGFESGSITSIMTSTANNLTFTSVTLNGAPFSVDSTGAFESRHLLNAFTNGGAQSLVISGVLDGGTGTGAYGGVVSFSPAIPEPASWALMILGVGLAGGAIRLGRRRSAITRA